MIDERGYRGRYIKSRNLSFIHIIKKVGHTENFPDTHRSMLTVWNHSLQM